MTLFEITTGEAGTSYERCYVWAPTKHHAEEMFFEKGWETRTIKSITRLFDSDEEEFITNLSCEGWEQ